MSRAETLRAIQCPACGAGLDVLGGGRVAVMVCPYCTTELDAVQNFAALRKFEGLKRPNTPFRLGMEGEIAGVRHQIIGILGQVERWKGREWHWAEHLLYSETHGYSWLSLEEGHCLWSRRVRWSLPETYFNPAWINRQETRPSFNAEGRKWSYLESTSQTADYVEGSFTWVPKLGDLTSSVSYLADGEVITVEVGATETEQTLTRWLPRTDVARAFGLAESDLPRPQGRHPAEPLPQSESRFTLPTAAGFVVATLAMISWLDSQTTLALPPTQVPHETMPKDLTFEITQPARLARIELNSPVANAWVDYTLEITRPDGNELLEVEREIGFFSGRDEGETWSEGSQSTSLIFRPAEAGLYTLRLTHDGGARDPDPSGSPSILPARVTVQVQEGHSNAVWPSLAIILFLILGASAPLRRWIARKDRLRQGDWDEE